MRLEKKMLTWLAHRWLLQYWFTAFKNDLGKKMTVALSLWHNSQTFLVDLKLPEWCWHQPSKKTRNCLQELITMSFPMNKKWLKLHIAKGGIKFYLHKEIEGFLLAQHMMLFLSRKIHLPMQEKSCFSKKKSDMSFFPTNSCCFPIFSCFWNHILILWIWLLCNYCW